VWNPEINKQEQQQQCMIYRTVYKMKRAAHKEFPCVTEILKVGEELVRSSKGAPNPLLLVEGQSCSFIQSVNKSVSQSVSQTANKLNAECVESGMN
jgi:hypothetical protein